jgi:hypothetical protein
MSLQFKGKELLQVMRGFPRWHRSCLAGWLCEGLHRNPLVPSGL